jgi:uncharacterized protein YkwD
MTTVKAPTLAASVKRFIFVARPTLPGWPSQVDFRTAQNAWRTLAFVRVSHAGGGCVAGFARLFASLFLACLTSGCAPRASLDARDGWAGARPATGARTTHGPQRDMLLWQTATESPRGGAGTDRLAFCGEPDAALDRVAELLLGRQRAGLALPEALELDFLLRASGEPHVWPHAWTLSGALDSATESERLRGFLDSLPVAGLRRCGVARGRTPGGAETVTAVVVDALADLSALPTAAHVGQWLRFDARMRVTASAAKLVVLGPSGPPRTVPTTLHGDHVEATFAVERPGAFTVQLLASVEGGPRPVLEAAVFVDLEPPGEWAAWSAPGEGAATSAADERDALRAMVNAARASENVAGLAKSEALDQAAQHHAEEMKEAGVLAHDAGGGGPPERLARGGIQATLVGENVAHESSAVRVHRALWASPSHRENLLDPRFGALGVGVARDTDGSLWVCETFTDFGGTGIVSAREPYSVFRFRIAK